MRSEIRTQKRTSISGEITFEKSAFEHGERSGRGRAVDISSEGIGIETGSGLKAGSLLKLYIPARGTGPGMPVFAEVMWVKPYKKHYRAGLRYLG